MLWFLLFLIERLVNFRKFRFQCSIAAFGKAFYTAHFTLYYAAALLYAAVMLIPSCRNKPVRLILPATLGGIVLTCTESYLFLLTSQPEQFEAMWDYLCTDALALAVIIILVSLGLTASMVLLVLHILGIFRSDIAVLAVIGFSILCCIAEYVAGMILLQGSGFPWYMLSVLFFLTAELFTVPQLQMASSEGKDA